MKKEQMIFDKRLQDRFLKKGELTKAELEKHLKNLPDKSDNVEIVQPSLNLPAEDKKPE